MNKRENTYLRWSLVFVCMVVIFKFSNDPAQVSNNKSGFVIELFNNIGVDLSKTLGSLTNFIVRKMGHFIEFLVLYFLVYNALKEKYDKKAILISLVFTFLYACSDEFHQIFVSGREGRFTDVLIDISGGMVASICLYLKLCFNKK